MSDAISVTEVSTMLASQARTSSVLASLPSAQLDDDTVDDRPLHTR
jgi:hypothetical protein